MRLNVELRNEAYEELTRCAAAQGRSVSDVVRQLVHEWCAREQRAELRRRKADEDERAVG